MELKEEFVDEKNEKIINQLNNIFGSQNNKKELRKLVNYSKIINECNVEHGNYNILISNCSAYNSYEKLIDVILDIYYENGIIASKDIFDVSKEQIKFNRLISDNVKIEESVIIINSETIESPIFNVKKYILELMNHYSDKIFILVGDGTFEEEEKQALVEYVMWFMKIDRVSLEEKEIYVKEFFKKNAIKYDKNIINTLSDKPLYVLKKELIEILIKCKMNNINVVDNSLVSNEKKNIEKENKREKSPSEELEKLIGLEETKEQINKIVNYIKLNKQRKNMPMLHMCFTGNPGTGKTTVARIVGRIFAEEKILSDKKIFVEAQRADLIGEYVGQTAPKTERIIKRAKGGVLFIDEAYSIASYIEDEGGRDYGAECVATLIKEMEDNRDNLCVIFAGYTKEMEHMLSVNPGFSSRVQFVVNFPDYTSEELYEIFKQMCREEKYKLSSNIKSILVEQFDKAKKEEIFSNGRYVRNIFEKLKIEQAYRVSKNHNEDINLIKKCDVENVLLSVKPAEEEKIKIGFAS